MEFSRGELENLLEFILREMTGKETSVAVLGDEISVNVEGKQTSFCVGP